MAWLACLGATVVVVVVVVVAGPGQGEGGKTGPGPTKPKLGTTGKPAKSKQKTLTLGQNLTFVIRQPVIKVSRIEHRNPSRLLVAEFLNVVLVLRSLGWGRIYFNLEKFVEHSRHPETPAHGREGLNCTS